MFTVAACAALALMCVFTGTIRKELALLPVVMAFIYPDNPLGAAAVALAVVAVFGTAANLVYHRKD
jgi:hypothetical protein